MSKPIEKKNDPPRMRFDRCGMPKDLSDGQYLVAWGDDYPTVTITVRLKYHSEHCEGDEALPEQKGVDPEYELLTAAVERFLCRTRDGRIPRKCQLLKPQVHEFQYRGEVSDDDQPSTTSPAKRLD